jgi:hypothetical protein
VTFLADDWAARDSSRYLLVTASTWSSVLTRQQDVTSIGLIVAALKQRHSYVTRRHCVDEFKWVSRDECR